MNSWLLKGPTTEFLELIKTWNLIVLVGLLKSKYLLQLQNMSTEEMRREHFIVRH